MRKLGEVSFDGDFKPDPGEEEPGSGARNARLGSVAVTEGQGKPNKARLGKNTRGKSRGTKTMARARVVW